MMLFFQAFIVILIYETKKILRLSNTKYCTSPSHCRPCSCWKICHRAKIKQSEKIELKFDAGKIYDVKFKWNEITSA